MDNHQLSETPAHPPDSYPERPHDYPHSGPGIASFVIGLISIVGYVVTLFVASSRSYSVIVEDNRIVGDVSQTIMFLGLAVLSLTALNVIGVVIGIIGISLSKRRKLLGIIGTLINGLIILLFMFMVAAFLVNAGSI
ncbi:hypothetical protein [Paenibacillus donghaensis]|uniref:Uncharacterized protein n=1 Tax=Paenibacillus donghaensis TaxID=414771 RepID=A0A2Z2K3R0_9BACL|nr:hypothetical protein [Paenibacillus donghaensis]ASA20106.1 hypothetical protein B9T62_04435 [Paenibacillus donghaensis]